MVVDDHNCPCSDHGSSSISGADGGGGGEFACTLATDSASACERPSHKVSSSRSDSSMVLLVASSRATM